MRAAVFEPRKDLVSKLRRRAARYLHRDIVRPHLDRGLVSFSFDDCPTSAFETALPMAEQKGWRATIYASVGLCNTFNHLGRHMTREHLIEAHERGHEIADHTFSHGDAMSRSVEAYQADIRLNREAFLELGLPRARSFAFPYGDVTPALKKQLSTEFDHLRGVHDPSGPEMDSNLSASAKLYSSHISETLDQIERAAKQRSWLILFGHDVRENPSEFGCTPDELATVIERIETLNLDALPVSHAYDCVRAS